MKDVAGHTDFVQQADRPGGDQRRLLCRLDVHRIVRRKHCRELSAKDRQGVVTRANAGKDAAAPQTLSRSSPRGSRHALRHQKFEARRRCIVAQEGDRLAQLNHGIVDRPPRLANGECHQGLALRLIQVGRTIQSHHTHISTCSVPLGLCSGSEAEH